MIGERRAVQWVVGVLALAGSLAGWAVPAWGEVTVGLTGGLVWPAEQDVRILSGPGAAATVFEAAGVSPSVGPAAGLTVTYWLREGSSLGFQLDGLYWATSVDVGPGEGLPERVTVDQDRVALLVGVMGRWSFSGAVAPYVYGGLGGGVVFSRVRPGRDETGPAVGAVGGLAWPLGSRLRLRVETRYLVTPDVDADGGPGVRAETSGTPGTNPAKLLFGPHLDTQFVPLLVGLDWVF